MKKVNSERHLVLPAVLNHEQRLTLAQVATLAGIKRTTVYARIKEGKFPKPEKDGPRCSRWRAGDVLAHLEARRGAAHV